MYVRLIQIGLSAGMSTPAIRGIIAPVANLTRLLLALFVFGVAANHPHCPFAADDLAVLTDAFDAGSNFHVYRLTGKVVRKTKDQYCSTDLCSPQASRGSAINAPLELPLVRISHPVSVTAIVCSK